MKTIDEINERIRKRRAVVLTASEVKELSAVESTSSIARTVDVVTTATFSPMCSSGAFLNLGHTSPPMKMQRVTLDGVPAYGGLAAVDVYIGATEAAPGNPSFGGAHVIRRLITGETIRIVAEGEPTDCYRRSSIDGHFTLDQINQAYMFNPRNCYQNYNAAVNSSTRTLYTYMGILRPEYGCVSFSGTGEISPLINDPLLRTIGVGTPVFCCGAVGYIVWEGTQFNGAQKRDPDTGIPIGPAGTLAVIADLRGMKPDFIKPIVIPHYGVSLSISIGIAIPVLDEEMARALSIRNREIRTNVIDYATGKVIGTVDYRELMTNTVNLWGKRIHARTFTNRPGAERITTVLKEWIETGRFTLNPPLRNLPISGVLRRFPQ